VSPSLPCLPNRSLSLYPSLPPFLDLRTSSTNSPPPQQFVFLSWFFTMFAQQFGLCLNIFFCTFSVGSLFLRASDLSSLKVPHVTPLLFAPFRELSCASDLFLRSPITPSSSAAVYTWSWVDGAPPFPLIYVLRGRLVFSLVVFQMIPSDFRGFRISPCSNVPILVCPYLPGHAFNAIGVYLICRSPRMIDLAHNLIFL